MAVFIPSTINIDL